MADDTMNPLPSLDVLKTFTVVAQHLNFTRAAAALHITQGAVSRQIAGLEDRLGYPLFLRQARGLRLTPQGAALFAPLQQSLAQIADLLEQARRQPATLRIKCPTCAMRWMLPQVIRLQNEQPGLRIELTAVLSHEVDFRAEHFDAAVVFGQPPGRGLIAHRLFDEHLTPVCVPHRLPDGEPVEALAGQTLLHPTRDWRDWLRWLKAIGADIPPPTVKSQHFETLDLAIAAALQGHGIAIGDPALIREDIEAGRLVTPFARRVKTGDSYYLVYPTQQSSPPLTLFVEKIRAEAADLRAWLATRADD
jgi:LysR family transcriptional regulator, glycine cleavage system transcriptional activator